jgi:DNA-binding NarL/FixJ family response regulator
MVQTRLKTNQQRTRTPSPPIDRGEHDTPARVRVLQLREEGHTVAQIRKKTGIPERTQRRFATAGL